MNHDIAVHIEGLKWRYKGSRKYALNRISLSVRRGEMLWITGPSGAGKTTLCLCFNGIIPQRLPGDFEGNVVVSGLEVSKADVSEIASKVTLVFEDPETQFVMTSVEEEIALGLEAKGILGEEARKRIKWSLQLVGLDESFLNRNPLELSGGEKQRVAIASALAVQPEILVLDEPTSDLDPEGKREVLSAIANIRRKLPITIIVVEHETEALARLADNIAIIDGGTIVYYDSVPGALRKPRLLEEHGVRPLQYAVLAERLGITPTPISLEEAENSFRNAIRGGSIRVDGLERVLEHCVKPKEPYVILENVYHTYPNNITALRGVSIRIGLGEFIAILGPNGSGKTTLSKVMAGLIKPSSGYVSVEGVSVHNIPRKTLVQKIAYVFQNPDHQIFTQRVLDEVSYGPRILGLPMEDVKRRVKWAIDVMGLNGLEGEHPFFLSKGERRRLALAAVLALKPRVLIVDEPTTGQDNKLVEHILRVLYEYTLDGNTVIVITHSVPQVLEYANRLIVMHSGKIVGDGPPMNILCRSNVIEMCKLVLPDVLLLTEKLKDLGVKPVLSIRDTLLQLKRSSER